MSDFHHQLPSFYPPPHESKRWDGYMFLLVAIISLIFLNCQSQLPEDVKASYSALPDRIDFNFHIRPILSDRCFSCHGPDNNSRKGDLRLDLEENAFASLSESKGHAFVKGNPDNSVALQRMLSNDPEQQMPPPESNLKLTSKEKALIVKWIEQGAEWKEHWAFTAPQTPTIPNDFPEGWKAVNEIDNFILSKVHEINLSPSPEADKERLIRRLSFDIRGLPASIEEIDQYLQDDSPHAYEKLVDRFLDSDASAERLAMEWMDLARFADSHGQHADGLRKMWPWRDWVISAFRKNLPYKDFVTWQLAGDLLPNSTQEQQLATGFHRNHPMNSESGIVSEEYRLKNVADRTNTTATAFLGLTMECAACHDHKFDPISQKEYYEMSAFFNNVPELGMIGTDQNFGPLLLLPEKKAQKELHVLETELQLLEEKMDRTIEEVEAMGNYLLQVKGKKITPPTPDGFYPFESITGDKNLLDGNPRARVSGDPEVVTGQVGRAVRIDNDYEVLHLSGIGNFDLQESFSAGLWVKTEKEGSFQSVIGNTGDKNSAWRGWMFYLDSLNRPGLKIIHALPHNHIHIVSQKAIQKEQWHQMFFTYDGSASASNIRIYIDGKQTAYDILSDQLSESILPVKERTYAPDPGRQVRLGRGNNYLYTDTDDGIFTGSLDQARMYNCALSPVEVMQIYAKEAGTPMEQPSDKDYLQHYLERFDPGIHKTKNRLNVIREEKSKILFNAQDVMVVKEMANPRSTYIQVRGQYDSPGDQVYPNTPNAVLEFADRYPKNRLGLAQWLFDDDNPLTARVAVNRYWQMIFGQGIVSTPHDFGYQGALPTHPELLDWLAVDFRKSGWNLRALLKKMVTSATYRQSSVATEKQMLVDANNTYLSVGASYRMQAEMIRDNVLFASGALSNIVGGASVKPYQPDGLWKEKNNFSGFLLEYKQDHGDSLYRRSLYTFIRRTSPPPAMTVFDVPTRDVCTVKRENTSTPLQALVLLNDPQFVEASRILAERMQKEGGNDLQEQTKYAFRLLCGRNPSAKELEILSEQYHFSYDRYRSDPEAATELLKVGENIPDPQLDKIKTAALAVVANTMMNFDEAYMKR